MANQHENKHVFKHIYIVSNMPLPSLIIPLTQDSIVQKQGFLQDRHFQSANHIFTSVMIKIK